MSTDTLLRAEEQVVAYFDVLRTAQHRYLDEVGSAAGLLSAEHGHVARAAAIQLRSTRRMFDAQRSIVTHRAEIDAELRAIRAEFELPLDAGRFEESPPTPYCMLSLFDSEVRPFVSGF